ncbi:MULTISPECIES: YrzI family small protein [Heyndrickxia]|nr:YrzI family small protein [Heyndrickxia shackletonii]MBB2481754.1 YrzI family small protein [Bacillus sp. APMAM]NEY99538.1 YrzI family small protein [Heyndrickxia shackletonii]RTZ54943.1 YrzI family small protein [Bacillus sp. SAJ1]
MTLGLILTKMNVKKRNKTISKYKREQNIAEIMEQNKLKHNEMMLRHYY